MALTYNMDGKSDVEIMGETIGALRQELVDITAERDTIKQQAQIHAQEARTANHTIAEIYQVCTGKAGEPGNWNGAKPVRDALAALRAELEAVKGPGTVHARFTSLMAELEQRFPHPNQLDSTKTPERYALEAIDAQAARIAELRAALDYIEGGGGHQGEVATKTLEQDDDLSALDRFHDATVEACAKLADGFRCGTCGMDGKTAASLRALKRIKP